MRCLSDDFISGSIFHIYNHAVDDQLLFYDDQDYEFFQIALSIQLEKIPASIIAYCLMPNHYHCLIRQDGEEKIYKIFNFAFLSYSHFYNRKYGRKGHIFRSPLQHKIVKDRTYLIQLCKYIHLNPVYAGLVEEPREWEFSNYREWVNMRKGKLVSKEICNYLYPDFRDYETYINLFYGFNRDTLLGNLKSNKDSLIRLDHNNLI